VSDLVDQTDRVRFRCRSEAGRALARVLSHYTRRDDIVVLALPRGGVPVGYEVAKELGAPLDVFLVRKLGVPGHEELAMGAIASGGVLVLDESVVRWLDINEGQIQKTLARELDELRRREAAYREGRPLPDLKGKTVILVDDGLATGASMKAAARAVRRHEPARIVIAVPVASRATCDRFREEVDEVLCAITPEPFYAVGNWSEDFSQTSDDEVRELLALSAARE
jgi:putative phosphoribosyl transferase